MNKQGRRARTINQENMNILYVPISQENRVIQDEQKRFISELIGKGWVHEGVVKLKDSFGVEIEVVVLKFEGNLSDNIGDMTEEEKACLVDLIDKKGSGLIRSLSEGKLTKESFNDQKNFLLTLRGKIEKMEGKNMKIEDIRKMFGAIKLVNVNDLKDNEEWADVVECLRCHKFIRVSSIKDKIDVTEDCDCERSKLFKSDLIRLIRREM